MRKRLFGGLPPDMAFAFHSLNALGKPVARGVQKGAVPHQSFVMPLQSALGVGVKSVTYFRCKVSVYKRKGEFSTMSSTLSLK